MPRVASSRAVVWDRLRTVTSIWQGVDELPGAHWTRMSLKAFARPEIAGSTRAEFPLIDPSAWVSAYSTSYTRVGRSGTPGTCRSCPRVTVLDSPSTSNNLLATALLS